MRWTLLLLLLAAGCLNSQTIATNKAKPALVTVHVKPGANDQDDFLTALIKAKPGTVIELEAGTYEFTGSLSLTVPGVTIRGAGIDKTILSFKKQDQGKEGMLVSAGDFTIEGLTIEDSKGDGLKVVGCENVTMKQVRARWTGGSKPTNGAYGLYPVQCSNVLVEECEADGASDAGIYVGQSKNVIVRHCKATRNVAGIEIENCTNVDVTENTATDNTGGILVFDLPNLPAKNGKVVRVFKNIVIGNNHRNFAPAGNIVATVPPGTGMMVLAMDQVEFFENQVKDNNTTGLAIISFHITQKEIKDKDYDPFPEGIYVHDNHFSKNGAKPGGELGVLLAGLMGSPLPDILYDGNIDPKKKIDNKTPENLSVWLSGNPGATFANLHYDGSNLITYALSKPKIERTMAAHEGKLPALPVVFMK